MKKEKQTENPETLKEKIKQQWQELADEELEQIAAIVEKKCKTAKTNLEAEEHHESRDFKKQTDALKKMIVDLTDEFFDHITHGEEEAVKSAKSHLFPTLGLAAIIGFILGSYLTNKLK